MENSALPPLRETIEEYGLNARKSLGQHFLLDLNITRKIARLGSVSANETVIEIGPGPGGLTRALLETGANVVAIERDSRCIAALNDLKTVYKDRFEVVEADAMKVNEQELINSLNLSGSIKIASNLPYNISTELLVKWLKVTPTWWSSLTLMFQKEVADRILATPGSKTYGRLSVISQAASSPARGFDLPSRAFTPPPKVDSTVLQITPKALVDFNITSLELVTAAAFSQRRKMLRASLKPLFQQSTESILEQASLNSTFRAEQISVDDYIKLSKLFDQAS